MQPPMTPEREAFPSPSSATRIISVHSLCFQIVGLCFHVQHHVFFCFAKAIRATDGTDGVMRSMTTVYFVALPSLGSLPTNLACFRSLLPFFYSSEVLADLLLIFHRQPVSIRTPHEAQHSKLPTSPSSLSASQRTTEQWEYTIQTASRSGLNSRKGSL